MKTVYDIFEYLGPKQAICCYAYVYNRIDSGTFTSTLAIKNFLRGIIKQDGNSRAIYPTSYFVQRDIWINQAKEIFLFITEE